MQALLYFKTLHGLFTFRTHCQHIKLAKLVKILEFCAGPVNPGGLGQGLLERTEGSLEGLVWGTRICGIGAGISRVMRTGAGLVWEKEFFLQVTEY